MAYESFFARPTRDQREETVLVLSEDLRVRRLLFDLLAGDGYRVIEAINRRHAELLMTEVGAKLSLIVADARFETEKNQLDVWRAKHVRVPVTIVSHSDLSEQPARAEAVLMRVRLAIAGPLARTKILVVDDNDSERGLISAVLDTAGWEVTEASNGKQALKILAGPDIPDVVLTDMVLPEKDGLELIQEVNARYPHIRVFAMSGSTRADSYFRVARHLGVRSTFRKPLEVEEVLRQLRKASVSH